LADNLRAERARCNLTLKQVADRIGVQAMTICNWERGRTSPKAEQLAALARVFRVSVNTLLTSRREVVAA
jgi:transcriptional regulator with XRE-family HTH domain